MFIAFNKFYHICGFLLLLNCNFTELGKFTICEKHTVCRNFTVVKLCKLVKKS